MVCFYINTDELSIVFYWEENLFSPQLMNYIIDPQTTSRTSFRSRTIYYNPNEIKNDLIAIKKDSGILVKLVKFLFRLTRNAI